MKDLRGSSNRACALSLALAGGALHARLTVGCTLPAWHQQVEL
jgi:hypothetical protein